VVRLAASDNKVRAVPLGQLPQATRRRLLLRSAVRLALTAVVVLVAYFLLPFTRLTEERWLAVFAVALVVLLLTIIQQIRATLRSTHPGLRAAEALFTSILLFMVVFGTTHYLVDLYGTGSYSQGMTRVDALYFVTTTLATVGFGDIVPISELARILTMLQMIGGIALLGIVAKVLLGAARSVLDQRGLDASKSPPS